MLNNPDEQELSDAETEARVRRSLGLSVTPTTNHQSGASQAQPHTGQNANPSGHHGHGGHNQSQAGQSHYGQAGGMPRRRFVRDGEVPVVVLHPKSEADSRHAATIADLTRQRDSERAARLRAEQSLHEALATIQTLQTRLAHADIAREERRDHDGRDHDGDALGVGFESPVAGSITTEPAAVEPPALNVGVPVEAAQAIEIEQASSEPTQPVEPRASRRRRTRRVEPVEHAESEPVKWWRDPDDDKA